MALLLLAGCTAPADPGEPEAAQIRMLALDGRWPIDVERAEALLAQAGTPAHAGQLVFGEARADRVLDFVGVDERAAAALGIRAPARGEAIVPRALGIEQGATLDLRAHSWPTPYVATFMEMERTPRCDQRPDAKLCFLPELEAGTARLRLRVDEGARDAGFLPDLVELGPGGRPAFWNGTFTAPDGSETPFAARALLEEAPVPAEFPGAMAPGHWTISFRLESNGKLAPSGAAGIVRVREPGYTWFDDRMQEIATPEAQARAVLANATPTRAEVTVAQVVDASPFGNDIIMISIAEARALVGTLEATALLMNATAEQERAIDRAGGPDGFTNALRVRALPTSAALAPAGDALLFAAPHDVDLASLPRIEGAGAPALALAGRPPVGEVVRLDGDAQQAPLLLLAHADGPVPWGLPAGGRWSDPRDALDNLSRSRTLALASADITTAPLATVRVELGEGNTTRTLVAIGGVERGPSRALWSAAALVAGAGQPVAPRVVLPLDPGADREAVRAAAMAAWASLGLAGER